MADYSQIVLFRKELRLLKRARRKGYLKDIPSAQPLLDRGLLVAIADKINENGFPEGRRLKITDTGRRFLKHRSAQLRRIIINSIVVPVIVAIITSAVTVYILPPLGKRAESWLERSLPPQAQSTPAPAAADDQPEN